MLAPHQVRRAQLQGDLGHVSRRLTDDDVRRMDAQRRKGPEAIKDFGEIARTRRLGHQTDCRRLQLRRVGGHRQLFRSRPRACTRSGSSCATLPETSASGLGCRVELRQVGPRDEARLLGGLGRCGRTLCCSSWLPVFPEISMSMAKNQDFPLNPAKVSGVCGRLLCCLSYENDQYRQMKAVMPKLGQAIDTPGGMGQVVSMQLLKELVTVRLDEDNIEVTFRCDELGLGGAGHQRQRIPEPAKPVSVPPEDVPADLVAPTVDEELRAGAQATAPAPAARTPPERVRLGSGAGAAKARGDLARYLVVHAPSEREVESVRPPTRLQRARRGLDDQTAGLRAG